MVGCTKESIIAGPSFRQHVAKSRAARAPAT
jgi:hypothetical protein